MGYLHFSNDPQEYTFDDYIDDNYDKYKELYFENDDNFMHFAEWVYDNKEKIIEEYLEKNDDYFVDFIKEQLESDIEEN